MRIWHEQLISKLCQKHLCATWREGLGCYKIITEGKIGYSNHPANKEFLGAPLQLHIRLRKIRIEMLRRGYNPKQLPQSPIVYLPEFINEWQTLEEQIEILKSKKCNCKI